MFGLGKHVDIPMKYSSQVKPISYLKANATEVVKHLAEAKKSLVMLKILALGNRQIEEGRALSLADALRQLRQKKLARRLLGSSE
jgi:hypothetical protein